MNIAIVLVIAVAVAIIPCSSPFNMNPTQRPRAERPPEPIPRQLAVRSPKRQSERFVVEVGGAFLLFHLGAVVHPLFAVAVADTALGIAVFRSPRRGVRWNDDSGKLLFSSW